MPVDAGVVNLATILATRTFIRVSAQSLGAAEADLSQHTLHLPHGLASMLLDEAQCVLAEDVDYSQSG